MSHVTYEQFGATGDGATDDLAAIRRAHEHANAHGLPVRSEPAATYHLGRRALTVVIKTDTDWNTSRFTIDDRDVEDHKASLFDVQSSRRPIDLKIDRLARDQQHLGVTLREDCYVAVRNDQQRNYIRRGLNQNNGVPIQDSFILRGDGAIDSPIDWDYPILTNVEARPLDSPITIRGGIFTTIANCWRQEVGYNYHARNITIHRSNTTVDGLCHHVCCETDVGHPYCGFIKARSCANITYRNCFVTAHKIYQTLGRAGKPVSMGSYDLHANHVINFRMIGCTMHHITDTSRWGIIGSNFCKEILLEDCVLSRMDTHMGVSGGYTIRNCTLGHMGINAIGRGDLTIEDTAVHCHDFLSLRGDYGATWQGDVTIRNSHWHPRGDGPHHLIATTNDGTHDFGYPCSMPHTVTIAGLTIHDTDRLYLFTNPDNGEAPERRDYPYARTRAVTIHNLTTPGDIPLRTSSNPALNQEIKVTAS